MGDNIDNDDSSSENEGFTGLLKLNEANLKEHSQQLVDSPTRKENADIMGEGEEKDDGLLLDGE